MGHLKGDTNVYGYLEELQVGSLIVTSIKNNWDVKTIQNLMRRLMDFSY
jgi:hypothetical protein